MAQHYRSHPLADTAVCGVDMVGRRNSVTDIDPQSTDCPECMQWLLSQELMELLHPDPWGQAEGREG